MFLRHDSTTARSDGEFVAMVRGGHREALGALWDRYAHLLFGVAMKYLKDTEAAKDLVMALFEELPALIAKHEVRSFRPWVHAVTRNRCLMLLRKRDPSAALDPHLAWEEDTDAPLREASLQALEAALEALPEGQRACIQYFHLEHNSYRQVAARTGLREEQVRSHLQNGRRNLRIILQGHGPEH